MRAPHAGARVCANGRHNGSSASREHRAALLHYVAANSVENYRQKTPKNIVRITQLLLDAGAEVDASADMYGGNATALGLAATSIHPLKAGVQIALIDLLLEHGAQIDLSAVTSQFARRSNRNGSNTLRFALTHEWFRL